MILMNVRVHNRGYIVLLEIRFLQPFGHGTIESNMEVTGIRDDIIVANEKTTALSVAESFPKPTEYVLMNQQSKATVVSENGASRSFSKRLQMEDLAIYFNNQPVSEISEVLIVAELGVKMASAFLLQQPTAHRPHERADQSHSNRPIKIEEPIQREFSLVRPPGFGPGSLALFPATDGRPLDALLCPRPGYPHVLPNRDDSML